MTEDHPILDWTAGVPVARAFGDPYFSLADGLVRVLFVTLYVCAAMAAVGAIGLAISTFTEHAIGAIAALIEREGRQPCATACLPSSAAQLRVLHPRRISRHGPHSISSLLLSWLLP